MKRSELSQALASRIIKVDRSHPIRIAIDGPDAAGKTVLADELVAPLEAHGRPVIRASIDGFHNPARLRYKRGSTSPEGYYRDSFDYQSLIESLLVPLGAGGSRRYRSAVFDYRTDSELQTPLRTAEANAVLLFDGVFLLRSELIQWWDLTIFVDAGFETTLARAEQRDAGLSGSFEELRRRYRERYIPGQRLYIAESRPREHADVVVNNNDLQDPVLASC